MCFWWFCVSLWAALNAIKIKVGCRKRNDWERTKSNEISFSGHTLCEMRGIVFFKTLSICRKYFHRRHLRNMIHTLKITISNEFICRNCDLCHIEDVNTTFRCAFTNFFVCLPFHHFSCSLICAFVYVNMCLIACSLENRRQFYNPVLWLKLVELQRTCFRWM